MDEFRYYDRALSNEDVLALYGQTGSGDDDDIGRNDNAGVPAGGMVNNSGPAEKTPPAQPKESARKGIQRKANAAVTITHVSMGDGLRPIKPATWPAMNLRPKSGIPFGDAQRHGHYRRRDQRAHFHHRRHLPEATPSQRPENDRFLGRAPGRVSVRPGRGGPAAIGEVVDLPHNGPTVKIIVDPVEPIPQLRTEEYWWADVLLYKRAGPLQIHLLAGPDHRWCMSPIKGGIISN